MGLEFGAAGFNTPGMNNMMSDFFMGTEGSMDPYNKSSLNEILRMLKGKNGIEQNQTYQGGNNFLQNLFSNDPQQMQQFQAPYMENFQQNIVPDIANRFAGMGTGASGLSSSGFQQTLAQGGRGLQKDLAQMRGQQQMQGLNAGLQYAQQPISNRFNAANSIQNQYYHTPGQQGFLQSVAPEVARAGINYFMPGAGGAGG